MKVLIGSTNESKIKGLKLALERYYDDVEVVGYKVESNVPSQPKDDEIYLGAKNRVENLAKFADENQISVDYYASIESGLFSGFGKWVVLNVACIRDRFGKENISTSAAFPVPDECVDKILQNGLNNAIENDEPQNGSVFALTNGEVSRTDLNEQAFILCLSGFISKDKWKN